MPMRKRCERCEEVYDIPTVKQSHAKDLIIRYFPCPHCYHRDGAVDTVGRCKVCAIPFTIINHHGKGMCKRDHQAWLRANPPQKQEDILL